jgi:cytochrome oxidase assembly protein ShyY1
VHRVDISILNHEELTAVLMIGGAAGLVLAVLGFWLLRRRLSSKSTRVAKVQSRERKGRRKK